MSLQQSMVSLCFISQVVAVMEALLCAYTKGEFYLGNADVEIGTVRNTPFYMSAEQFEYWEHTHITLDAIKGTGGQFSLERPTGLRFIIRSRIYTDEEWDFLKDHPVKHCG
jgi:uncharacterized protein (DUF779 family)